ncbi:MAG: hypothetical protein V1932_02140 [Chloroflexota bacterium]
MSSSVMAPPAPDGDHRQPQGHCSKCGKVWTVETGQGVCQWCGQQASRQTQSTQPRQITVSLVQGDGESKFRSRVTATTT